MMHSGPHQQEKDDFLLLLVRCLLLYTYAAVQLWTKRASTGAKV